MPRTATSTRRVTQRRTPINGEMGGTQTETVTVTETPQTRAQARSRPIRQYGPTQSAERVTAGVGLLEAEFLGSLLVLVLIMFANTESSYADKIMSTIKRGTLISLLFFILALISGTGPNAAKVAKALGGLVFVATLLTTPVNTVITDIDALIKSDWPGTTEHGQDVGSADSGTQSGTSGTSKLQPAQGAIQRIEGVYSWLWHATWGWLP